jgi:hypothetical protein
VRRDDAGVAQVAQPVGEGGDVAAAHGPDVIAAVLALQPKALGKERERAEDVLVRGDGLAAALR